MNNLKKISVLKGILLSIVTLGIYSMYWMYVLVKNVGRLNYENDGGIVEEFLCILFVPFYSIYWWYSRGVIVENICKKNNQPVKGSGVVYLILSLFRLDIVSMAIMQSDFNSYDESVIIADKCVNQGTRLTDFLTVLIWFAGLIFVVAAVLCWLPVKNLLFDAFGWGLLGVGVGLICLSQCLN